MLSEADTRTIDACRQVLRDLATVAERDALHGRSVVDEPRLSESYSRGLFAGYCTSADHALAAVLAHADTYLDSVHAEASLRQAGPRPLEP